MSAQLQTQDKELTLEQALVATLGETEARLDKLVESMQSILLLASYFGDSLQSAQTIAREALASIGVAENIVSAPRKDSQ